MEGVEEGWQVVYRKGIRHSSRGNTGAAEGPYSPQQGDGIDEEPLVSRSDQIPAEMYDITDAEAGPSSPHQGSDIAYVSRRGPMLCALGCDLDTIDTSKIPLYLLVRLLTRYAHPPLRNGNELGKAILYARIQKSWSRAELARPINERECDFAEYEHNKTLLNPTIVKKME